MAIVIEFQDIVEARRRRRQRESLERCVEIIELNLRHARWMSDYGPAAERSLHAHRIETLRALHDYAERVL
jgi:hypothetical protein